LNVEPGPHFPNQFILNALGEIPVKEAQVGHESGVALAAKFLASGLVSFTQRPRQANVNEQAAKIFLTEIDLLQPDGKGPQGGGNARRLTNQITALAHATPKERYVRGEFRCLKPGTQSVDDSREAVAHITPRH
jgi:hypothetical protein